MPVCDWPDGVEACINAGLIAEQNQIEVLGQVAKRNVEFGVGLSHVHFVPVKIALMTDIGTMLAGRNWYG